MLFSSALRIPQHYNRNQSDVRSIANDHFLINDMMVVDIAKEQKNVNAIDPEEKTIALFSHVAECGR